MQTCLFHSLKILRWSPPFVGQSSDSFAGRARGCVIWPLLSSPVPAGSPASPSVLTNVAARSPSRFLVQGRRSARPLIPTLASGDSSTPFSSDVLLPPAAGWVRAVSFPWHPHCKATVIYPSACPLAGEPGTTSESLTAAALVPGTAPATWSALSHDVFGGLIWGRSEPAAGTHRPHGSCALPPRSGWAPGPGQGLCPSLASLSSPWCCPSPWPQRRTKP